MVNDSVRLNRVFANMSDEQISALTTRINKLVHIVIGVALIVAGFVMILGRNHN